MRIALGPINPIVGDIAGNAALAARVIAQAAAEGADLVVLPELCISGYPPRDLLMQEGFVQACEAAAQGVGAAAPKGLTVVLGTPLTVNHGSMGTTNSLVVYRDGQRVDTYDKQLLPTYDVFDENRYFVPGSRSVVLSVPARSGMKRVGLTICEDLWKGEDAGFASRYADAQDPVARTIAAGAEIIVSPSASPFVIAKSHRHRHVVRRHAEQYGVPVYSVNQLGGNDELVFDGHAFGYGPQGVCLARGTDFSGGLVIADSAGPPAPEAGDDEMHRLFQALVLGVRDYLRKTGFTSAILGLSGGIDSALTATIAAAAIGGANVRGYALPSRYSSDHSIEDAKDVARRLGMACHVVEVEPLFKASAGQIDAAFAREGLAGLGATLPDLTEENLQSRLRGVLLMAFSNRSGSILLTTGNKSELAVGYCTLYGDMNGGLAVLSDLSKMTVYALSRWINANWQAAGFAQAPIPQRSIDKAPSAELRPNQTDQDSLPPYDVLDEIVERTVEGRQSLEGVVRETGFAEETVRRVRRLIDLSEYKRKQTAVGLKVTSVAFGSGRRMPIAQRWRG